ncbi:MAG TPA: hypothetical protein PKC30_06715 [Saprospiraceae bacterium]|nr:hypothetical protein [Saprospiraceae bacterium]
MISHWLKPVENDAACINNNMKLEKYTADGEFDLSQYRISLISSPGHRSQKILESLSFFENHFKNLNIIDLGIFRKSDAQFNIQLVRELNEGGIIPVILDQDFRWFSSIMNSLSKGNEPQHLCISNNLMFSEYGISCDFMAFQRQMVKLEHLHRITDHSINSMSLGKLRADSHLVEPAVREYTGIYFDICAIRRSDVPGCHSSLPTGLSAEEACQLLKYAGGNTQLKLLVIGGDYQPDEITSDTIAQALWYFMEGVSQSHCDHPAKDRDYQQFIVENDQMKESFYFVKNNTSDRWWFLTGTEPSDDAYIACSYQEYLDTIHKELPDRLLKHLTKLH